MSLCACGQPMVLRPSDVPGLDMLGCLNLYCENCIGLVQGQIRDDIRDDSQPVLRLAMLSQPADKEENF